MQRLSILALLSAGGLGMRWLTAGAFGEASASDLQSLLTATVAAVAWLAYSWLVIVTVLTVLLVIPGVLGRAAGRVAGAISTETTRMALRAALGVAVAAPLTVGVAASAQADGPPPSGPVAGVGHDGTGAGGVPLFARDVEQPSSVRLSGGVPLSGRDREEPSSVRIGAGIGRHSYSHSHSRGRGELPTPDRPTQPRPRALQPPPAQPQHPRRPQQAQQTQHQVIVQPGDTLWRIAERELRQRGGTAAVEPAAVQARWRQWYNANRDQIGADPDLLRPGQRLEPPGTPPERR